MNNGSKIAIFALFFFFLISITIASDQLITGTTLEGINRSLPLKSKIVSQVRDQHFFTSDHRKMAIAVMAHGNNLSSCSTLVHPYHGNFSTRVLNIGMKGNANYFVCQHVLEMCPNPVGQSINLLNPKIPHVNSNNCQKSMNSAQYVDDNISRKIFESGQFSAIGPNIGALAAVATDVAVSNSTIARPESIITKSTYYDVRGANIGALAAVAADKAVIDATITQLNGSAVTIQIAKNPVQTGTNQSVTITVFDKLTKKGLEKASVDGWVSDSSGITTIFFSGLTNGSGNMSSSWHIASGTAPGKASIFVESYHKGYQRSTKSEPFLIKA